LVSRCLFALHVRSFVRLFVGVGGVVVVVGGGGVDIAVDDNGVLLTLGESLFACVACACIRSLVRVFGCLFGFVRSFVLVLVLISLSTTMEFY
jgi:hypothetical protein